MNISAGPLQRHAESSRSRSDSGTKKLWGFRRSIFSIPFPITARMDLLLLAPDKNPWRMPKRASHQSKREPKPSERPIVLHTFPSYYRPASSYRLSLLIPSEPECSHSQTTVRIEFSSYCNRIRPLVRRHPVHHGLQSCRISRVYQCHYGTTTGGPYLAPAQTACLSGCHCGLLQTPVPSISRQLYFASGCRLLNSPASSPSSYIPVSPIRFHESPIISSKSENLQQLWRILASKTSPRLMSLSHLKEETTMSRSPMRESSTRALLFRVRFKAAICR